MTYEDPSDEQVEAVQSFAGTPQALVELLRELWWLPETVSVEQTVDDLGGAVVRVSFVTSGWSGNETLLSALGSTLFHGLWWQSSVRGGLSVYEVPLDWWTTHFDFGLCVQAEMSPEYTVPGEDVTFTELDDARDWRDTHVPHKSILVRTVSTYVEVDED